jgi:hypothetical protein
MEDHFLLPQSKFDELITTLREIKSLVLEIKEKPKPLQEWVPENEVQKLLGLKATSLWGLRKNKKLIYAKIGSRIFYKRKSIEDLMSKNEK